MALLLFYISGFSLNVWFIFGFIVLASAIVGFCPIYHFFGINQKLFEKSKYFEYFTKANTQPIFIFSKTGEVVFQNEISKKSILSITNFSLISKESAKSYIENSKKSTIIYRENGKSYQLKMIGFKQFEQILVYAFDITTLEKTAQELVHQKTIDPLTSLGNGNKLLEDIKKIEKHNIALIVIDIVDFNEIVSFFGHKKADKYLNVLSVKLLDFLMTLKQKTYLYKLQGDSFAILINYMNISDKEREIKTKSLAKGLLEYLETNTIKIQPVGLFIEARAGISTSYDCYKKTNLASELINNAQTALSECKTQGRNYLFYKEIRLIGEKYKENIQWAKKLKTILKGKSEALLLAYFQPILNVKTNTIEQFEALARIEEKGNIYFPNKFLHVAKHTHLLPKITHLILTQTLENFKNSNTIISLNLSQQDLKNSNLANILASTCKDFEREPDGVIIELHLDDIEPKYLDTIDSLKIAGFRIAIDHFGVGNCDLEVLAKISPNYLKIDKKISFGADMDDKKLISINAICAYAKTINAKTVAIKIESKELFDKLKNTDIDFLQGNYIGAPSKEVQFTFNAE